MKKVLFNLKKYKCQYIMIMCGIVFLILFSYIPMLGLQIAFRDFRPGNTIWNARFVGLENFWFFGDSEFWRVVKNTLVLTLSRFLFTFPTPIILALLKYSLQGTTQGNGLTGGVPPVRFSM
ncbi:hypothetical protein CE91St56_49910 [Lachnospiraceae bacterium]|nr:hypothetical protein CE91St56_49910 [Lachnospiraceae bacterium]GKH43943.1 hypothetical protein CE91St57_49170 [Lachnospiraceae bacterium]